MRTPHSTYRLQINESFPLADAARWVDYLRRLGADWVYCSPLLQAEPGSDHGYDVVDHSHTDASRGGRTGLAALADAAYGCDLGVLVDIVPNHVGVATPAVSAWWRDVLTLGQASPHATAFDIDWAAGNGRIRIPVLGDGPDELDALRISDDALRYYDHALPIAPGTYSDGESPLEVHDRQHYGLVNFRRADTDLNYRRFFAVNSLAGLRMEVPQVFAAAHQEIRHWMDAGWVDGLRVDHPDGLADPRGYLADLAELSSGRYTVVEKILEPGEELPSDWQCAGTTGYDTLSAIDRVLVDPAGQGSLDALDTQLRGEVANWRELSHDTKRAVADGILNSEIRRLARLLPRDVPSDLHTHEARDDGSDDATDHDTDHAADDAIDALAELMACFPVYRSFLPTGTNHLRAALDEVRRRRNDLAAVVDVIDSSAHDVNTEFAGRLQQTTGAVMAKGVEDCAFYRYPRLTSLTEVGGDPAVFDIAPTDFHAMQQHRLRTWPDGMTTLSTHDTKRGEDVRARITVLSEVADDWAAQVQQWLKRAAFPDSVLGNLLLQTAVGAWPIGRERLHAYAEKAAREAGNSTEWIDPDAAFEEQLHALVDACYDDEVISRSLTAFADRVRPHGWSNSLAAKLIQLTLPGVPDVYRGTELWQNSLVDPDNRRPFDAFSAGGAGETLQQIDDGWLPPVDDSGAAKLLITSRALRARRDHPALFTAYTSVTASGPASNHLLGFDRGGAITVATRLPVALDHQGGWGETSVTLPDGQWHDVLTGRILPPGGPENGSTARVADILSRYPVALLLPA